MKHPYSILRTAAGTVLFATAALAPLSLDAQNLRVQTEAVEWQYDAATLTEGEILLTGSQLTIAGTAFPTRGMTWTVDAATPVATEVSIDLAALASGRAVTAPGRLAGLLTVERTAGQLTLTLSDQATQEVTFRLKGKGEGSVILRGSSKSTVVLDGAQLTATGTAPALWVDNGKRINLIVADGTENVLADAPGNAKKAALFVKGHVELSGTGSLSLTGNARHAYASNEYTHIEAGFGTLRILGAASDGLHIGQYFRMDSGTLTVTGTQGDCVDVEQTLNDDGTVNTNDELNGQVLVNGGTIELNVAAEDVKGLKAETDMTIAGGTINATVSGAGSRGISVDGNLLVSQKTATPTNITMAVPAGIYHEGQTDEEKARGIRAKGTFTFDGGTVRITATGRKAKAIKVGAYTYVSGDLGSTMVEVD